MIKYIGSSLLVAIGLSLCIETEEVSANRTLEAGNHQTQIVDRDFAIHRHIEIEVTPSGVVLDIGSVVTSVRLPHQKDITVSGFNGCLGTVYNPCEEDAIPPTKLYLQKNEPIEFPEQIENPGGITMLYVNTEENLTYRYTLIPTNNKPKVTLVEIVDDPIEPLFPFENSDREVQK